MRESRLARMRTSILLESKKQCILSIRSAPHAKTTHLRSNRIEIVVMFIIRGTNEPDTTTLHSRASSPTEDLQHIEN